MSKRRNKRKRVRRDGVFLLVFGLGFFAFGVFMACHTVSLFRLWQDAKSWVAVDARIESVDLEVVTDEDGDTYKVTCHYVYEFDGACFEGDRVGLEGAADNVGDWQRATHRKLKAAHEEDRPVTCYVDPAHPERAILRRELRPGMVALFIVFAVVFLAVGAGVTIAGVSLVREAIKASRPPEAGPEP